MPLHLLYAPGWIRWSGPKGNGHQVELKNAIIVRIADMLLIAKRIYDNEKATVTFGDTCLARGLCSQSGDRGARVKPG
jgi:hypothetical protein